MKTILFDLDGTLHNSEQLGTEANEHAFRTVLHREMTNEERQYLVGKVVPKVLSEWFPEQADQVWKAMLSRYDKIHHNIQSYDGICSMLNVLKAAGYKMGIATSKKRRYVIRELQNTGLYLFFTVIVAQEDSQQHKPHPAPLALAANHLNVLPDNCVYIGDQPSAIQAAHAAGMSSIAALWGEGKIECLEPTCPTTVAFTPSDILTCLSQIQR